jgi:hypothetical protein
MLTCKPVGTEKEHFKNNLEVRSCFNLFYEENNNNKNNSMVGFHIVKSNSSGLVHIT